MPASESVFRRAFRVAKALKVAVGLLCEVPDQSTQAPDEPPRNRSYYEPQLGLRLNEIVRDCIVQSQYEDIDKTVSVYTGPPSHGDDDLEDNIEVFFRRSLRYSPILLDLPETLEYELVPWFRECLVKYAETLIPMDEVSIAPFTTTFENGTIAVQIGCFSTMGVTVPVFLAILLPVNDDGEDEGGATSEPCSATVPPSFSALARNYPRIPALPEFIETSRADSELSQLVKLQPSVLPFAEACEKAIKESSLLLRPVHVGVEDHLVRVPRMWRDEDAEQFYAAFGKHHNETSAFHFAFRYAYVTAHEMSSRLRVTTSTDMVQTLFLSVLLNPDYLYPGKMAESMYPAAVSES